MTFKYFKLSEFTCPCKSAECNGTPMNNDFIILLDIARDLAKTPFVITSGIRCKEYNNDLIIRGYKASKNSSHLKGVAADISCKDSLTRFKIINGLLLAGFSRIGISDTFIHVDLDLDKQQNVIWTY